MRPRRYRRGEPGSNSPVLYETYNASMRPRRYRRGELGYDCHHRDLNKLLQCGHGGIAVENISTTTPPRERRSGFNAATAVSPWRTWPSGPQRGRRRMLQCGHGGIAVENA